MAQDNMRDPKSGRKLSQFEATVRQAQLDAATHGQTGLDRQMSEFSFKQGLETQNVRKYVSELEGLIQNFNGPAVQLRKVIPLMNEVMTLVASDPTLTKKERATIRAAATELIAFVQRKSALLTRTSARLKALAKEKLPDIRSKVTDQLGQSESVLAKLAGKALARREKDSIEKAIVDARASLFGQALDAEKEQQALDAEKEQQGDKKKKKSSPISEPFELPMMDGDPTKKPKRKRTRKVSDEDEDTPSTTSASDILTEILGVNQEMLRKIEVTNQLLRTGREDAIHAEDAAERKLKNIQKVDGKSVGTKDASKPKGFLESLLPLGLLDRVKAAFGNILMWFGPGSTLAKMVMPALELLGSAAAVIGAAWVGWKVGDWISQLVGLGSSSEAFAKLMDGSQGVLDTLKSTWLAATGKNAQQTAGAKEDTIEAARAHAREMGGEQKGFNQPNTIEDAVKINNQWGEWKKAQVKKAQTPKPLESDSFIIPTQPVPNPQGLRGVSRVDANPMTSPNAPKVEKVSATDISDAGIEAIKKRESFSSKPYWDETGYAIGYGSHQIDGREVSDILKENPKFTISKDDALRNLKARLTEEFVPTVRKGLKRNVSQSEFDSLVSIAYNRGKGKFLSSKDFLDKVNRGDITKEDFLSAHGSKLTGKVKQGVESRRAEEYAQYVGGLSDRRNAAPLTAMNAARGASGQPKVTIVAPPALSARNDTHTNTVMPMPMTTSNPDAVVRAMKSVNTI